MPPTSSLRRAWIVAATGAALTLTGAPAAVAQPSNQVPCVPGLTCPEPSQPRCANRHLEPAPGNLAAIRRATLCLINQERSERDLGKLRPNRALRIVATRYARSMVRLNFFGHVSPLGTTFLDRIRRSAYLEDVSGYRLGENLAWGGGELSTPKRIVRGWMTSSGHRANILSNTFRDIGVGVTLGIPVAGGGEGATYVNEFGARSRRR